MSEINVSIIKNENADYGPNLVGYSTVTGDLNLTGSLRVGAGLTISGITTFSDNITFDGDITAGGNVNVTTGNVTVTSGNVSVGDSITLYSATGVVTAAKFHGDGSELVNLPSSAGLGTALSEDTTSPLNVIYYTDASLAIGATITVDAPDSAKIAYTQYPQVILNNDADLIVAAGDDFIPDILGIGTTGVGAGTLAGDGGRVRADNLTNRAGTGAPTANNGLIVTGVVTATSGNFTGNVTIGGTLTYQDVTNIDSVGMITARKGIQVLADGINAVGVITATNFSGDGSNLTGLGTFSGNYNDLTNTPSIASQAEAEAGTNNTNLMTPLRVKQAIDALGGSVIASIQRGTYSWPSGTTQTTQNVTITSVDTSKTMMNYLGVTNKNNNAQYSEVILVLTNSTTVTLTRSTGVSGTSDANTQVSYEVIEFA